MHLGPIKVKPNCGIKAVWQCDKCPAGQPHVWMAVVYSRTEDAQCPYCSNRLVCLHNSLTTIAPKAVQYWNHSKNDKSPHQVLAGSSSRTEWQCPACNWEWQVTVAQCVHSRAGCPMCSNAQKVKLSQPTFAEAQPACLAEWDYEHNETDGFYPEVITLKSGKLVHWICSCCPRGQPHRWTALPYSRTSVGSGCAVCAGHQACVCNSLESLFPSIAAELDVAKNGFAPSEITAYSAKEVWWRNANRSSWKQTVTGRTTHRRRLQQV